MLEPGEEQPNKWRRLTTAAQRVYDTAVEYDIAGKAKYTFDTVRGLWNEYDNYRPYQTPQIDYPQTATATEIEDMDLIPYAS